MSFSALVFDIDGTLLDSQGRISDATMAALWECHRKGILLYVATARPPRLVFRPREVSRDVTFLTEKGVFYNGALAVDRSLGYSRHRPMSAELVYSIADYLVDAIPDLQIAIQSKDHHSFRLPMDESALASWGFLNDELLPFSEARGRGCSKMVAWHGTRDLGDVHRGILHRYGNRLNAFLTDSGRWLQLMTGEATKERGLLELLSLRDIPREEVAIFGDGAPDEGMFRTFGCSVAMANAEPTLKQIATYVTRSNDDDGVVFALERYLGVL